MRGLAVGTVTAVAAVGAILLVRRASLRWGATDDELRMMLPGDDQLPHPDLTATRGISIGATPSEVWPWLAQLGQNRGGFYSYDWLESASRASRSATSTSIRPDLQIRTVGEDVNLAPEVALSVVELEEERHLVLRGAVAADGTDIGAPYDFTWAFVLQPRPDGSTRLVVRERYVYLTDWAAGTRRADRDGELPDDRADAAGHPGPGGACRPAGQRPVAARSVIGALRPRSCRPARNLVDACENRRMAAIDPDSPRYARQRVLPGWGVGAQQRLADAHVVVLGAGGLGSAVVPALVAAGVGRITVVDDDRVEATNLHRQTLHSPTDVGRPKVDSAADAAAALSPETTVVAVPRRFDEGNAVELLADADLVIDGTDDILTRYVADDAAARAGIPLVWGSAAKFSGQVGVSWEARGVSYRDLFPEPPADAGLSCEVDGILPTVCTVTGGMMAGEALKVLTGVGEPLLGRVVVYDALSGRTREIAYRRAADAARLPRPAARRCRAAPEPTGEIDAATLSDELASGSPPMLLDVREPWEAAIAAITGSTLIPLGELGDRVGELDPAASVVVYCHLGVRSEYAARLLAGAGFARVRNLAGGIDAWSRTVDATVVRY